MKGLDDYLGIVFKFFDKAYKNKWLLYFLIGLVLLFLLMCSNTGEVYNFGQETINQSP